MSQRGASSNRGNSSGGRGGSKRKKNEKTNKNTNKQPRENQASRGTSSGSSGSRGKSQPQRGKGKGRGGKKDQYQGESRPIERRTLVQIHPLSGEKENVPLLDKRHAITSDFLCFLPSDNNVNHADTLEALTLLNRDAKSLLRLSFHEFWSTVTYNASFPFFVNSFLCHWKSPNALGGQEARNDKLYFMGNNRVPELRPEEKERRIFFLNMWKIIYRLTHLREGEEWMSRPHFAHLLRHGKILTVTSLIDICAIYGPYQSAQVSKAIAFLLEVQPDYEIDFSVVWQQTQTTLEQLVKNVAYSVRNPESFSQEALQEVVTFLYSITSSLLLFLDRAPDVISLQIADQYHEILHCCVVLFEAVIPQLKTMGLSDSLQKLETIRSGLYGIVRHVVDRAFVMPLVKVQRIEDYDLEKYSKLFLWFLTSLVDVSTTSHLRGSLPPPSREDMILSYLCPSLKLQSVLDTFATHFPSIPQAEVDQVKTTIQPFAEVPESTSSSSGSFGIQKIGEMENEFSFPAAISQQRLENIATVKSILDYLGDGFINECLELYNDNPEVVCDRILSESLAEPLLELDRNMALPSASSIPQPRTQVVSHEPVSEPLMKILSRKSGSDDEDNDEDFKELNKRFYQNIYDDEYDDSMDQYVRFGVDDGETEDERVSLTESGEFEQREDPMSNTPTPGQSQPSRSSKFKKTKPPPKRRDNKTRNH